MNTKFVVTMRYNKIYWTYSISLKQCSLGFMGQPSFQSEDCSKYFKWNSVPWIYGTVSILGEKMFWILQMEQYSLDPMEQLASRARNCSESFKWNIVPWRAWNRLLFTNLPLGHIGVTTRGGAEERGPMGRGIKKF